MFEEALVGRNILIVEDEYVIAEALRGDLAAAGANVVGAAGSVEDAFRIIDSGSQLDATILDANLGGDCSLRVVQRLRADGVPMLLTTGYDHLALPSGMRSLPRCDKPYQSSELLDRLITLIRTSPH